MQNKTTSTTIAKLVIDGNTYLLTRTGGDLPAGNPTPGIDPKQFVSLIERDLLLRMMKANDWNKSLTAKTIGVNRHTLIGRLQAKGLHPTTEDIRNEEVLP